MLDKVGKSHTPNTSGKSHTPNTSEVFTPS